jgi:hypothetical protein
MTIDYCRLSTVAPDLADWLRRQPPERLRKAAVDAALLAGAQTQLTDPRLDAALTALRGGALGATAERLDVQQLTHELDVVAWTIQETATAGAASRQAYSAAFRRARAAAAVGCALESDALSAALEGVYEAQAAVEDLDAMRTVVTAGPEQ